MHDYIRLRPILWKTRFSIQILNTNTFKSKIFLLFNWNLEVLGIILIYSNTMFAKLYKLLLAENGQNQRLFHRRNYQFFSWQIWANYMVLSPFCVVFEDRADQILILLWLETEPSSKNSRPSSWLSICTRCWFMQPLGGVWRSPDTINSTKSIKFIK